MKFSGVLIKFSAGFTGVCFRTVLSGFRGSFRLVPEVLSDRFCRFYDVLSDCFSMFYLAQGPKPTDTDTTNHTTRE